MKGKAYGRDKTFTGETNDESTGFFDSIFRTPNDSQIMTSYERTSTTMKGNMISSKSSISLLQSNIFLKI